MLGASWLGGWLASFVFIDTDEDSSSNYLSISIRAATKSKIIGGDNLRLRIMGE